MSPFQQTPRQRVADEPFLQLSETDGDFPHLRTRSVRLACCSCTCCCFTFLLGGLGGLAGLIAGIAKAASTPAQARCTHVKTGRLVRLLESDSTTAATRRGNFLRARLSAIDRLHGGLRHCRAAVGRGGRFWHRLSVRLSALSHVGFFQPAPGRFPSPAQIARGVVLAPADRNRWQARWDFDEVTFLEGESCHSVLPWLAARLDGVRSLAQLQSSPDCPCTPQQLAQVLEMLMERTVSC